MPKISKKSTVKELRAAVKVLNILKEINPKISGITYFDEYNSTELTRLVAEKAKLYIHRGGMEAGKVDLAESIQNSIEYYAEINRNSKYGKSNYEHKFPISDELKEFTKKFEKREVKDYGPSNTRFGEIFRALQYMEFRAGNDGDHHYVIGSPSFVSYVFLQSEVDYLNYSSASYNNETGQHEFKFSEEIFQDYDRLEGIIEDPTCKDGDYLKYQLMDLLKNGKLEDEENYTDSRDYSSLRENKGYW